MLGYRYLVLFSYFSVLLSSASSSSPATTIESISPRTSSISTDKIFKCNEIFKKHLEGYTVRTRFAIPLDMDTFYADIFIKAVFFAARTSKSFDEVIFDNRVSVTFHCFLLEYFLLVLGQEREGFFYSELIYKYSKAIALTHHSNLEDSHVINVHLFPLLNELVLTGNFLNYSFLLSTCVDRFNSFQKDQIYSSHCRQYFFHLQEIETSLELEAFGFGIEFLNLYIPRSEILSIVGVENYQNVALFKPLGYYLISFNPLRAAVQGNVAIDLERIKRNPFVFESKIDFFIQLESFLNQMEFLNCATLEQFNLRKSVFNALINNLSDFENVLLLVNCGFITCFQAWIQFQYTSNSIDDWSIMLLKNSCYYSSDKRFKETFDNIFKK
jgi:hypothetical protein